LARILIICLTPYGSLLMACSFFAYKKAPVSECLVLFEFKGDEVELACAFVNEVEA